MQHRFVQFFYYLFFSFALIELQPFALKRKVLGEKFWKSVKNYEMILPFSFSPISTPWKTRFSPLDTGQKRPDVHKIVLSIKSRPPQKKCQFWGFYTDLYSFSSFLGPFRGGGETKFLQTKILWTPRLFWHRENGHSPSKWPFSLCRVGKPHVAEGSKSGLTN